MPVTTADTKDAIYLQKVLSEAFLLYLHWEINSGKKILANTANAEKPLNMQHS